MEFNDARVLDSLCFQMRQADYPRSLNRSRIDDLFNGVPPYTTDEVDENEIEVNVNELSGTIAAHDARSQFSNAFLKPGKYFDARTDSGPIHKRDEFGSIVTKEVNKIMKRSIEYGECFKAKFAMDVLHGIAPSGWRDADSWCPDPIAIEDVMVPANTLLTMRNLPFIAIYRSLTAPELKKMTQGPNVDPGWNMPLVKACIEWVDEEAHQLMGTQWPDIWCPEKQHDRIHGDGGYYTGDQIPTIDCWDFYFWNDEDKVSGWNRRIILDAWSTPSTGSSTGNMTRRVGSIYDTAKGQFLYNPGKRKWADRLPEIVTWQFADLSAKAPFRYHSVRSLGFLLYAVCHIQNRLYSKFTESQFEQLMMYFRVKSADEMQRALKVDLVNRGFIDDTINFIPRAERYQVDPNLINSGLERNSWIIGRNSSGYTSTPNNSQDTRTLTATQWIGEANKVTALVSSSLNQAYIYQAKEYREVFRRFLRKHSKDPEVLTFQAKCLKQGVPPAVLYNIEAWDLEPERVVGAGNKTLEMAIADWLMQHINLFDPRGQDVVKKTAVLAVTEDPAKTNLIVPDSPQITNTVHDAQLAAGTLMQGLPVALKPGINHIEYVETMMVSMAMVIKQITSTDQVGTPAQVAGLSNMAQHIAQHIDVIAQDKNEAQRVKKYGDQLGKMMNLVKAFAQRQQEAAQQAAQVGGNGGPDPETQAKIQAMMLTAEAKAANTRESHAQRTAQRQMQWELEQQRKAQQDQMDLAVQAKRSEMELQTQAAKAAIDVEKASQQADKAKKAAKKKSAD